MRPHAGDHSEPRLLLLSPSAGIRGGIERVMDAIVAGSPGPVERVDLLHAAKAPGASAPQPQVRVSRSAILDFTGRAFRSAVASRPDVVVCGLLSLLPVAAAVAFTFRCRLALVAHGVEAWRRMGPGDRALIRRCTHLLAVSSFTADVLATRARIPRDRISVVALPMAEGIAAAAQAAVDGHVDRRPAVLTVSRIERDERFKGHFAIARCFGRVLERRPDATWVVVGDGSDLAALRSECGRLGIQDAVTFKGAISDAELIASYRMAAVFALPSLADPDADPPVGEGFGLVYAEAGAFGLPVIAATPGGGSSDFVVDGETGLTVNPRSPDELAEAIVALLDDPDLRTALGQQARSRAFARHLPPHFRASLRQALQ